MRVLPDVEWGDLASVRTPWWRRLLSAVLLVVSVVVLGLVLAVLVGGSIAFVFLLLDQLVG